MKGKFVVHFPRYWVTPGGRVVRLADKKTMTPQPRGGYLRVKLQGPCDRRHWVPVHRIVLEAFVGPRPSPRHHGAHKNGNAKDNRASNLVWKLPHENEADKKKHGTASRPGRRRRRPLSLQALARIHCRHAAGESFSAIGKRYGLHRHSVARIVRRRRHG